jgi:hypothetical protein
VEIDDDIIQTAILREFVIGCGTAASDKRTGLFGGLFSLF